MSTCVATASQWTCAVRPSCAADWPLFGADFTTRGVKVLWPKKVTELVVRPGALSATEVRELHRILVNVFPPGVTVFEFTRCSRARPPTVAYSVRV